MTTATEHPKEIASALTDTQKLDLCGGLLTGERARRSKGNKQISPKDCRLGRRTHHKTKQRLNELNLIRDPYWNDLTAFGVKVAREAWTTHGFVSYDEETEKPIRYTVEEYVQRERDQEEASNREFEEKLAEAKRLWRGFSLDNTASYRNESKTMTAHIHEGFEARRGKFNLDLDDLIFLGRQVQTKIND